jgi:predicted SnoaL-like aldol condensation-catalyzing enzyme
MSTEANKATIRRGTAVQNTGNVSAIEALMDELYTDDYVLHDPKLPKLPPGPAGAKQIVRWLYKTMPDYNLTIEHMVAEGDLVASRYTGRGTNAETGKAVIDHLMLISRFVGDKIAEEWELVVEAEPQA